MESSRFFVANLPTNTTEKDLQFLFQDYGVKIIFQKESYIFD